MVTPADRQALSEFQAFLRRAPIANTIHPWFDGDVHLVAPTIADRSMFIIVDGEVQPP